MPFDISPNSDRPPRPEIDRDATAAKYQERIGRPLTWDEYVDIWNFCTAQMGRSDFLTGELE